MKNDGEDILLDRVRAALAGIPELKEKRMFGSTGFMVRGHLCLSVRPSRLMCRIDPAKHGAAIQRKGCETVVMKGRPYPGWVYVDADVLGTDKALLGWIGQALEFNDSLAAAGTDPRAGASR